MVVKKAIKIWELNILKGIASQLQVDTPTGHFQKILMNDGPNEDVVDHVYKEMEVN